MIRRITSARNPALKEVRALAAKKVRRERRLLVAEGEDLLVAARAAGVVPRTVLADADRVEPGDPLLTSLEAQTAVYLVPGDLLAATSSLAAPPRILAVLPQPGPWSFADVRFPPAPGLVLDGVGDPGNVGTLVRSAAALGAEWIALAPGSADPYHPRAVRAAMGSTFALPLLTGVSAEDLATRGPMRTVVAAAAGGRPPWEFDLTGPLLLVLGGEREGVGALPDALGSAEIVTIPQTAAAESLNVAAAGSALLAEVCRQRRAAG